MTRDEKWMNRLKKCLKDMPQNRALHIKTEFLGSASVELCDANELAHYVRSSDDLLGADSDSLVIEQFSMDRVYPNSESI